MRSVILTLDGAVADRALPIVREMARRDSASVVVVHVGNTATELNALVDALRAEKFRPTSRRTPGSPAACRRDRRRGRPSPRGRPDRRRHRPPTEGRGYSVARAHPPAPPSRAVPGRGGPGRRVADSGPKGSRARSSPARRSPSETRMCAPKTPCSTGTPSSRSASANAPTSRSASSGGAAAVKPGPIASRRVAVERELRHGEHRAARVEGPRVHPALAVGEHPKPRRLARHPRRRHRRVSPAPGGDEHEEPRTDRGDRLRRPLRPTPQRPAERGRARLRSFSPCGIRC